MQVKGLLLGPIYEYLKLNYGDAVLSKVLEHLTIDGEKTFRLKISTSLWYPYEYYIDLLNSIYIEFGSENPNLFREIGKYAAKSVLKTPYHIFFRIGTPKFIIRISSKIYSTYFDEGKLEVLEQKEDEVLLKISILPEINDLNFEIILGWMEGAFNLSGEKNPRAVLHEKSDKEEKYVIIKGTWKE